LILGGLKKEEGKEEEKRRDLGGDERERPQNPFVR